MAKKGKKTGEGTIGIAVQQGTLDERSLEQLGGILVEILETEAGDCAKVAACQTISKVMKAAPVSVSGCMVEVK